MNKSKIPKNIEKLKPKIKYALKPIKPAYKNTKADNNFLFKAQRTNAGRSLPDYYLVYFLLHNLLGFNDLGKFEKVAWSIPIEFNKKAFLIEHRKFGVGIFASDPKKDESDAEQIVRKIQKAVKIAKPYFEWLANQAVSKSELNINNKSNSLYERYDFFLRLYHKKIKEAKIRKDEIHKKARKTKYGIITTYHIPYYKLRTNAKWLAIATIDAFFSWTEHLFIHLAVIAKGLYSGKEIAVLAEKEWQEKFKKALTLKDKDIKKYFDELIIIRRQLRNFIAHGAFGKNGEAFKFHSNAGTVPVLMPHQKGRNRFVLSTDLTFNEEAVLKTISDFIRYLWSSNIEPGMYYIMESGLPTILPMAKDGDYLKAMKSREAMESLVSYLSYQFDMAANMDW